MSTTGPLRDVTDTHPVETDGRGNRLVELRLDCGHTVIRQMRRKHRTDDDVKARCSSCGEAS